MNSVKGVKANEAYSNVVKLGNIEYAMIDKIKKKTHAFEDVITEYFEIKGEEVLKDLDIWVDRVDNVESSFEGMASQNQA
eukprot:CAMPEP_0170535070 /NCGR_PEP_ID=MMETSP0209-20121228/97426_1 /TAXON_ID=665100 ORGANISM="Litonotus pictus, Strain P1" /NCGR_SAMPLE_ID=MMETSP0209 /ASSEMBLY_ACC=CAM_ASM_000301 /LENGTH=79 /DNA_ID=CAMNT_0010835517 /DNA_START=244 /DNA_END=479 /DNA_ORIENTATION=-